MGSHSYQKEPPVTTHRITQAVFVGIALGTFLCIAAARFL